MLKSHFLVVLLAGMALLLLGCGSDAQTSPFLVNQVSQKSNPLPSGGVPQGTPTDMNGIQTTLDLLVGNYLGKWDDPQLRDQSFTFRIEKELNQSVTTAALTLASSGQTPFTVNKNYLKLIKVVNVGYDLLYTFQTDAFDLPSISPYGAAVQVTLALRYGNQFDPAQSTIAIMECGFSRLCGNPKFWSLRVEKAQ